jgi:hypothetical protein
MPAKILSMASKRRTRMERHDYHKVCTIEVLRSRGNDVSQIDLETFNPYHRDIDMATYRAASCMVTQMFGYEDLFSTVYDGMTPLYRVDRLTLQETAIAERLDISHAEKIDAIRPLRAKRKARAEALDARDIAKWNAAHPDDIIEEKTETDAPQSEEQSTGSGLSFYEEVVELADANPFLKNFWEGFQADQRRMQADKVFENRVPETFEQLIGSEDAILARGMGIVLD